jgi:hypothetical protein
MSLNRVRVGAPPQPSLARRRRAVAVAVLLAACSLVQASAAQAAIIEGGSGAGTGRLSPAAPGLAAALPQPRGADVAAQPPRTTAGPAVPLEALPSNASTGLTMSGSVTASWSGSGIDMKAANISNTRSSGTSGTLRLQLWATTTPPVFGNNISFFPLGPTFTLGTLMAGFHFTNVDSGLLAPFTPPPNGCYFITVALEEFDGGTGTFGYVDLVTFTAGGVADPGGSGFDLFAFGVSAGSCSSSTGTCSRTATTACLLSSRFQVRVSFVNASSSGNGTVMNFGSTRAENDESVFLYFTDPSNFEMGLKILDACVLNNHFWVFIGGLTNQGWTVQILDTSNGSTKTYHNPLNQLTPTTADTSALACP